MAIKVENTRITITLSERHLLALQRLMEVQNYKTYTRAIRLLIDLYITSVLQAQAPTK